MSSTRSTLLVLVLSAITGAALLALAGCPAPEPETTVVSEPPAGGEGGPSGAAIKIGALFAVTGAASPLGEPERDTAVMLARKINEAGGIEGRPIEVIVRDTKSEESEALNAAMELIDRENVVAIIGPSRSGTTMALVERVQQAGVPLISCAAARAITDPVKQFVFQVAPGDRDAVFRIYSYMAGAGITKVATLTESSGYGEEGLKQLQAQTAEHNIEIVADEQYSDTDTDMTAQLTSIKGSDAQACLLYTSPSPRDRTRSRMPSSA